MVHLMISVKLQVSFVCALLVVMLVHRLCSGAQLVNITR